MDPVEHPSQQDFVESENDLRQPFQLIRNWIWLLVLATLLGGAAAYVTSSFMTPIYSTSAILLVDQTQTSNEGISQGIMPDRPILSEVAVQLGLDPNTFDTSIDVRNNPVLLALLKEVESLDTTFLKIRIQVVPVQNTQLIEITVEDDSPELAAGVANTLAQVFIAENTKLQPNQNTASETNLQEESTGNIFTIAEPARVPELPARPRTLLNTLLAAVAGLVVATGVAFLTEYRVLDGIVQSLKKVLNSSLRGPRRRAIARRTDAKSVDSMDVANEPRARSAVGRSEATYKRSPLPTVDVDDPVPPQNRPAAPAPDVWLPEDEIDLREYVYVLLAWRREIVAIALVTAAVAVVSVLLLRAITPPTFESTATVAIARTQSNITFDPRFVTGDLQQAQSAAGDVARRTALVGLVSSGAVAQAVIDQLGSLLSEEERNPAYWLGTNGPVKAELVGSTGAANSVGSDLISITVSADSAQKAAAVANAWATNYVEQVNRIYGQVPGELVASVTAETVKAQTEYESAQRELEDFVAQNQVDRLTRLIAEKQDIIASLQAGKQTAVTTIVDEELKARQQIIAAYINAQSSNRLLTFNKEQEAKQKIVSALIDADTDSRLNALQLDQNAKTQLFNAYVNADVQSQLAVFTEQTQSRLALLSTYYESKAKLQKLLDDARALQSQATQAGNASAGTNGLALLLLKAEVYATSANLPGSLQITLGNITDVSSNAQGQVADLDALIQVLDDRLTELELSIADQSQTLLSNEGYQFIDQGNTGAVGEDGSALGTKILEQYNALFTLSPLAQASTTISTTTPVFAAISEQYPDLFEVDALAALTDLIGNDNPLATLSTERAKELLQLQGLENLPAYTAAAGPLTQSIDQLESEIQALQAQQEAESSRQMQLAQRRDLAWSTLTTLKNKNAELNLSVVTVNSEVRMAAPAVAPIRPVAGPGLITTTALAGIVGLMLAVFVAFFANFMGMGPWWAKPEPELQN